MAENKRSVGIYAVLAWMIFNAVFYALELTIFNDAADLNNSINVSSVGIFSYRFNIREKNKSSPSHFHTHLSPRLQHLQCDILSIYLLNGTSAIINLIAAIYMFRIIFANKFR